MQKLETLIQHWKLILEKELENLLAGWDDFSWLSLGILIIWLRSIVYIWLIITSFVYIPFSHVES